VREFRHTWRGTRIREGKEVTRSGGRTGSLSLAISIRVTPRPDAPFAELLIDWEENQTLRAVLIGMVAGGRTQGSLLHGILTVKNPRLGVLSHISQDAAK
jgi:hypothetical protein